MKIEAYSMCSLPPRWPLTSMLPSGKAGLSSSSSTPFPFRADLELCVPFVKGMPPCATLPFDIGALGFPEDAFFLDGGAGVVRKTTLLHSRNYRFLLRPKMIL